MNKIKKLKWYDIYRGTWRKAGSVFGEVQKDTVNYCLREGSEVSERQILKRLDPKVVEFALSEYERVLSLYTQALDVFPEDKDVFEKLIKEMQK